MDSQLCLRHKAQSAAMHISVERGTHPTGRDEAGRGEKKTAFNQAFGKWRLNKRNGVSRAEYRAGKLKCKLEAAATSWLPLPATSAQQYAWRVGGLPSHGSRHAVQAVRARALIPGHRDSHARGIQAHRTRIAHHNKNGALHGHRHKHKKWRLRSAACRALTSVHSIRAKGCSDSE